MKIALVIHSLAGGGAERSLSDLANRFAEARHDVTVITLAGTRDDAYPLHPGVGRMALEVMHDSSGLVDAVRWNARRIRALRRALRELSPDCVISFTETMNVLTLLAAAGLDIPVVISERVDPRRHQIGRIWSWLRRMTYPRASALVVLTHSVRKYCQRLVGERPVCVIPNAARKPERRKEQPQAKVRASREMDEACVCDEHRPIEHRPAERRREGQRSNGMRIVAMGRLQVQKGFDLLIDAFARIAPRHPAARLDIFGEGGERNALQSRIDAQGLRSRVRLAGWTSDPASVLTSADLFVFSSRYEGFGNALTEAMACGLPAISFNCDSGPREIIREGIDGVLVPPGDTAALAEEMDRLISDEPMRRRLAARAPEILKRFSDARFLQRWETVVCDAVARKHHAPVALVPRYGLSNTTPGEFATLGGFP